VAEVTPVAVAEVTPVAVEATPAAAVARTSNGLAAKRPNLVIRGLSAKLAPALSHFLDAVPK
jgi:hypothetical protein